MFCTCFMFNIRSDYDAKFEYTTGEQNKREEPMATNIEELRSPGQDIEILNRRLVERIECVLQNVRTQKNCFGKHLRVM